MEKQYMNTPQNSSSVKKQQLTTSTSLRDDDCPYCQMKRKFNIGSSTDQKCFQHSIKINLQQRKFDQNDGSKQNLPYMDAEQMILTLEDVQNSLDYYWDNLRQISGGYANNVHKELEPVLGCIKKVQQKIGRFFYDNTIQVSQIKANISQTSLQRKFHNSGSQKLLRVDLSNIFDPQQNSAQQSIKEWVMHFYKVIQLRQVPQQQQLMLPMEGDLQMRIFKQSMQRKFLQFGQQISRYEKKVKDVLSKLIYYMQKSSDNVPQKQIQQDILFIEGQSLVADNRQSQLQKMLVMQASSMEYLIAHNT